MPNSVHFYLMIISPIHLAYCVCLCNIDESNSLKCSGLLFFFQSHPFFYTHKNSQELFGENTGFGATRQDIETDEQTEFESLKQRSSSDNERDSAGNHTVAIAIVFLVAVTVVVTMTVFGIRAWRRRKSEENQWLLSYRKI